MEAHRRRPTGDLSEIGLLTIPWLAPFQAARGLLWAGLAIPVLRMTRGTFWHAGLAVSLLFAVLMNAQLLLPNEHMPQAVRMVHLVETASSNFILGWWIAWLFWRDPARGRSDRSGPPTRQTRGRGAVEGDAPRGSPEH